MSGRYATQRSNRVRLKADCYAMLAKIERGGSAGMEDEIAEMMVRLKPPTGAAAPIVLTSYTQMGKDGKVRTLYDGGKVEAIYDPKLVFSRPVDGMDERFGEPLDSIRYRKD